MAEQSENRAAAPKGRAADEAYERIVREVEGMPGWKREAYRALINEMTPPTGKRMMA